MIKYINSIHEQLAVGLINAKSFEQLENVVYELEKLNEENQKQNQQTIEQNQQLKELHRQLQEKAEELEGQRSKAVELTKVKSEFLASMSHELRTPLISIIGLTELLLKDSEISTRTKERLNIVHRNGKKLLGLINNILEFSKLDSGKIEVKKESFLLSDLLDEINPNISQLTSEKNLKYIIDLEHEADVLLNTDKLKLEQTLQNLLVNAAKFTDEGFIKLVVKLLNSSDIYFEVVDTGIGISEENKKTIFNEFKQVDASHSRKNGGAGLGLAICKKYVELLGGSLSLSSQLGKGSIFSFTLEGIILDVLEGQAHKFLSVSGAEEKPDEKELKNDQITKAPTKMETVVEENSKPTVMIVDDDNDALFTVGEFIKEMNCDPVFAHNGVECLLMLNHLMPDIILLDIMMPQMDGFETIKRIRSDKRFDSLPVLALTAYAMLDNIEVIERNGFDDIVTKPINSSMLATKLKKFLKALAV